jgi:hypothetical protein
LSQIRGLLSTAAKKLQDAEATKLLSNDGAVTGLRPGEALYPASGSRALENRTFSEAKVALETAAQLRF